MTTYSYKCADCNEAFDIQASIQEKEEGNSTKFQCPACRSEHIKQEFSALHFIKNIFQGKAACCCSDEKSCDDNHKSHGEEGEKEGCCRSNDQNSNCSS